LLILSFGFVCVTELPPLPLPSFSSFFLAHSCYYSSQHQSRGSQQKVDHWLWSGQDSALNPTSSHETGWVKLTLQVVGIINGLLCL